MPMALLRREPNGPDFFLVGLFPGTISDCEESPQLSPTCPGGPGAPTCHPSPAAPGPEAEATSKKEQKKPSKSGDSPPPAQGPPPKVTLPVGAQGLRPLPMAIPPPQGFQDLRPKANGAWV